jgi:hypothetical protein
MKMKKFTLSLTLVALLCACAPTGIDSPPQSPTPSVSEPTTIQSPTPSSRPSPTPDTTSDLPISDIDFSAHGVYILDSEIIYNIDLNGDGKTETLYVHYKDEEHDVAALYINGAVAIDFHAWYADAIIIRRENDAVGAVTESSGSYDYSYTQTFRFDGITPVETMGVWGRASNRKLNSMTITDRNMRFIGNQSGSVECTFDDEFNVTFANDGFFTLEEGNNNPVTTKLDLDAQILVGGEYIDNVLPAGTEMHLTLCNTEIGCMMFETNDGNKWRFYTTAYGDVKDTEYFVDVVYAGAT